MVFEVVQGQVKLSKRNRFKELHATMLLPACDRVGIRIVMALMCDVGNIGSFIDVYSYDSYAEYESKSESLERHLIECGYYDQIQECIQDSIKIELMESFIPAQQVL